ARLLTQLEGRIPAKQHSQPRVSLSANRIAEKDRRPAIECAMDSSGFGKGLTPDLLDHARLFGARCPCRGQQEESRRCSAPKKPASVVERGVLDRAELPGHGAPLRGLMAVAPAPSRTY